MKSPSSAPRSPGASTSPVSVVAVIPSRYGSTRLPGKSLIRLCGKPLVQWVYERTRQAATLDGCWWPPTTSALRTWCAGSAGMW
jgi:hypothetical protein